MRKTIFVLFLTLAFGISLQAQSNQKVTVQVNQQKAVPRGNLKIKFLSLVEDSRCPTDAQCIQAGNAKIKIKHAKTGTDESKIFEINTNAKPQIVQFAGYAIKLVDLDPKPATNIRINRFGYKAILDVTRIKTQND